MNFLQDVPAVRRMETDRDDLFAIDIVGHVTAADAENLYGLLEAEYALHPKIDVLVRFVDHDGVDWAEISSETLDQGKAHAHDHVQRCATIGQPNWISAVQGFFSVPLPVELKHFEADDERAAWVWLGAKPKPADV